MTNESYDLCYLQLLECMKSETYKNRVMSNVLMKYIFMTTDNNFCYLNESHNLSLTIVFLFYKLIGFIVRIK